MSMLKQIQLEYLSFELVMKGCSRSALAVGLFLGFL